MYASCAGSVATFLQLAIDFGTAGYLAVVVVACTAAAVYTRHVRQGAGFEKALRLPYLGEAVVLVPLDSWTSVTKKGLTVALQLHGQVRVVHPDPQDRRNEVEDLWQRNVISPLETAGKKVPELVFLRSPEMQAFSPMAEYVLKVERDEPDRQIVVVVPELAVRHWWQKPLHNYRNRFLKWVLYARGSQRIMVIDVPWYL